MPVEIPSYEILQNSNAVRITSGIFSEVAFTVSPEIDLSRGKLYFNPEIACFNPNDTEHNWENWDEITSAIVYDILRMKNNG